MGYHDGNWGASEWLAMGTLMLLFWAVVIGLVMWALRSGRDRGQSSRSNSATTSAPDRVLAERYARGEIDEDEFLRRRELLHSAATAQPGGRETP